MMKPFLYSSLAFCCLMVACNSNENRLTINEMKPIMWDMITADEWFSQITLKDSTARPKMKNAEMYQQIFAKYKITKEQFYNSYHYFQMHPNELKVLIDSVDKYGSRIKNLQDSINYKNTIAK
ncbi:MAG: DUF4296 domain-containing protein [Chitinophagaceae bacterium]